MEAELLLLDEPTAHLDPRTRRELLTLLQTLPQTLIVATHDLDFALDLCPRTLVLSAGQLVADGPTEAIFERGDGLRAWGLEPPLSWRWRPQPPSTFPRKTM
jgi:cobalt/nickel transport system ATP-binding protein